jgi:hypothetical protein
MMSAYVFLYDGGVLLLDNIFRSVVEWDEADTLVDTAE